MQEQKQEAVVIVAAARTPIGSFLGGLSSVPSYELGARSISAALDACNVKPEEVSEVILGQVLVSGQGMNPARRAAVAAGIPYSVPASATSVVCGSGLRSVILAQQLIRTGEARIVVAGGQESMSGSMHAIHMREATKFGEKSLVDTMLADGLTDAFHGYHMGITAENVASRYGVTRADQDAYSAESQRKAKVALAEGHFRNEIAAVTVKGRRGESNVIDTDEYPKPNTTVEGLAKLNPAFKKDGTVTAGNASGLNDGAAAVVLMSSSEAERRGLKVLAMIASSAFVGVEPEVMGTGPIPAVTKALDKAGWSVDEVDLFELNEAFASQSLAVVRELNIDPAKVNVSGGAIALGHPIGASGCRILVTLVHALERTKKRRGVASLCVGGGMGVAICVERPDA